MRGNRIHSRAARRIRNDHRETATDQFDHRALQDGVHDDIVEDGQLATLEDAIATLEDVRDQRRGDLLEADGDPSAPIAQAIETLHTPPEDRVMEICAERCRVVLVDGDDWVDDGWQDADEIEAAQREAAIWLMEHGDTCRRLWGDAAPTGYVTADTEAEA